MYTIHNLLKFTDFRRRQLKSWPYYHWTNAVLLITTCAKFTIGGGGGATRPNLVGMRVHENTE